MEEDVRWIQRLANYRRAVVNLGEAAARGDGSGLNRLEKQGIDCRADHCIGVLGLLCGFACAAGAVER